MLRGASRLSRIQALTVGCETRRQRRPPNGGDRVSRPRRAPPCPPAPPLEGVGRSVNRFNRDWFARQRSGAGLRSSRRDPGGGDATDAPIPAPADLYGRPGADSVMSTSLTCPLQRKSRDETFRLQSLTSRVSRVNTRA